jgi:hypothetical protein
VFDWFMLFRGEFDLRIHKGLYNRCGLFLFGRGYLDRRVKVPTLVI